MRCCAKAVLAITLALLGVSPHPCVAADASSDSKSIQKHLDDAKDHMSGGRFNDALNSYDSAIALDSKNYLTYYRRAVAYLTMGRSANAIRDLTTVLDLNPKFNSALLQRGKQYLKECRTKEAIADLQNYSKQVPADTTVMESISEAMQADTGLLEVPALLKHKQHELAIEKLSAIITTCPLLAELRIQRADSYLAMGDTEMAIGDLSRAAKLQPDSTAVLYRLSSLRLSIGEPAEALGSVKECLKFDPENKQCKGLFRDIKKLDKVNKKIESLLANQNWRSVIKEVIGPTGDAVGGYVAEVERIGARSLMQKGYAIACQAYTELKDSTNGLKWCNKAVELDENDVDSLCNRGEVKIMLEEFEDAVRDFEKAHSVNNQSRRAHEGYQKAQRLLKAASRKDYYKILSVGRQASKKEIRKAYRKLAQEWHPDKYKGDLSKDAVLKRMSDINEAYETLIDDEKRARVDNGEDPNEQQQPQHPFFQQGQHFHFQGNPFQQHFKFNF